MKRYWVLRHGMVLNSEALKDLKAAQKFARSAEKDRKKKSSAKRSKSISDYEIVEEHIRYKHLGRYGVRHELDPLWEEFKGHFYETLDKAVKLILPKHLACDSVPPELREKIESLLQARTARRRGKASAGNLF